MKLYIIAGEFSGDFIGGLLIKAIKEQIDKEPLGTGNIQFCGIGGNNMEEQGVKSLFPLKHINLMGLFEIIPHIFKLKKLIDRTVEDVLAQNPNILVTIDSPGFTYRVASKVREIAPHIKLVHIVAPSVWAYRPSRARKYAKIYDHLLTLLPFEPKYFTYHGLPATFIGHPILEQTFYVKSLQLKHDLREELKEEIEQTQDISENPKIIAVTPGSRRGEISRHMPVIREALDELSDKYSIKAVFVQPDKASIKDIMKYLDGAKFEFSFSTDRLKIFAISDCALSKSGTNTIEIAASGTPMIVGYKLNPITFFFLKLIIKIKYATLINIIADKEIIPEYIQCKFNATNVVQSLSDLLSDGESAKNQVLESQKILESIGYNSDRKPSKIAAEIIIDQIK